MRNTHRMGAELDQFQEAIRQQDGAAARRIMERINEIDPAAARDILDGLIAKGQRQAES